MGSKRKGVLERLAQGPVLGDGGFCFALERRGYVKVGVWSPVASAIHPEAVQQLHREFLRAGADVMQTFTHTGGSGSLQVQRAYDGKSREQSVSSADINTSAYKLAREVADRGDALVSVSISETLSYRVSRKGKEDIIKEFREQLSFYKDLEIDFIVCEYFPFVEEIEWAIEAAKETGKPVAATMCIGPHKDNNGVPTGECAVRMAKAGADIIGINCNFGPDVCLKGMQVMKDALEKANLHPYLMVQPLGFHTPEVEDNFGYLHLPEHFLAYEPRILTRFEAQKYARKAYDMGIRYIGGCCGFEPYHIRAMSEELSKERGKDAEVTKEFGEILSGVQVHPREHIQSRSSRDIWLNMEPTTGRPYSAALAKDLHYST